jgi:hypothetical protein
MHNRKYLVSHLRLTTLLDCARKWYAQISVNRKPTRLGSFHTEDEAHAAYCIAARRVHGEFAREG